MVSSVTRAAALAAVVGLVSSASSTVLSAQRTPPAPAMRDLARDIACGPQAAVLPPAPSMRILGGEEPRRNVFGTAEAVVLGGGSAQGVRVGQEYFARRVISDKFALPISGFVPVSIHTAGVVRVVEVDTNMAVATVVDSCDGVIEGDYLEAYVRPVVPVTAAPGEPDFTGAGAIVLGDEHRQMGAAGSTMVLDRGADHGVQPGQRGTIFRTALEGAGPIVRIGEATAVLVKPDTSVIRIESSRDAVMVGDRVALHK